MSGGYDAASSPFAWDAAAEDYAAGFQPLTLAFGLAALDHLRPSRHMRLIDVAAGAGGLAAAAAGRGFRVTAVDFSERMVAAIRRTRQPCGCGRVTARRMDAQALRFGPDMFDAGLSVFGIMFCPRRRLALAELHRVVRPGGRVAVVTWGTAGTCAASALMDEAARQAQVAADPGRAPWEDLAEPRRLATELRQAGFRQVYTEALVRHWIIPSAEWLWTMAPRLSPVSAARFSGHSDGDRDRMAAAFRTLAAERWGAGPVALSFTANLAVGTVAR